MTYTDPTPLFIVIGFILGTILYFRKPKNKFENMNCREKAKYVDDGIKRYGINKR